MRRILCLAAFGFAFASPAAASDYTIAYTFPTADQTGLVAIPGAGLTACGGGVPCRALRRLDVHAEAGVAIPAGSTADILFTHLAGTTIAGGTVTVRYRTRDPGLHVRLVWTTGGVYHATAIGDRTAWTTRSIALPAGAVRVGPSLYAGRRIAAGAVGGRHDDEIVIERFVVRLRDVIAPSIALTAGPLGDGAWHAGRVCGDVLARDRGLGVFAVTLDAGAAHAALASRAGPRLRPRPSQLQGRLCVDTATLPDGSVDALLGATDGVAAGGNAAPGVRVPLLVDNTPPLLVEPVPAAATAAAREIAVRGLDGTSGIDDASAVLTLDGAHLDVTTDDDGWLRAAPPVLRAGGHRVVARIADLAGNVGTRAWSFTVAPAVAISFPSRAIALPPGPGRIAVRVRRGGVPAEAVAVVIRIERRVLGAAVTDARGLARVPVDIRRGGTLRATAGSVTAEAVLRLRPGVGLWAPPHGARAGGRLHLTGVVVPGGSRVAIASYAHGGWHVIAWARARRSGSFSLSVPVARPGPYLFRATARGHRSRRAEVWVR